MAVGSFKHWVKRRDHVVSRLLYAGVKSVRTIEVPVIPGLHRALYQLHRGVAATIATLLRVCYYTPLFKSQLEGPAPRPYLYSGLPTGSGRARSRFGGDGRSVGDIILEDDVWLASGVTVTAGVRIGHGTVVAAGSVVTKDLPPMVLAGGVPARVIRPLAAAPG